MTTSLIERLLFWRDTANLRSREIIRLNAEVERLREGNLNYRWLRDQQHSLESQHGAGKSCYHVVGGVRELKSGDELDAAVGAARKENPK